MNPNFHVWFDRTQVRSSVRAHRKLPDPPNSERPQSRYSCEKSISGNSLSGPGTLRSPIRVPQPWSRLKEARSWNQSLWPNVTRFSSLDVITRSQFTRNTRVFESSSRKLFSGTGSPPPGPSAGGITSTSPQWNRKPTRSLLDRL